MNTEQKQSINLSSYAYSILQDDMKMFSPLQTFNGFLNEVLERYSAQADASIHTALERQQDRLRNAVERDPRLQ